MSAAQQAVVVGSATTTAGYSTTVYEARLPQQCSRCGQTIPAGANFVRRRQHGGGYATFPVCLHCCPIRKINPAGGRLKPYRCSSCGRLAPQRTWRFVADHPEGDRFPWRSGCCGAILKRE